jgi:hypothetical protein
MDGTVLMVINHGRCPFFFFFIATLAIWFSNRNESFSAYPRLP